MFPQKKEQGQSERHSDRKYGNKDQPPIGDGEACTFDPGKRQESDGGDKDIHAEKSANASREELPDKEWHVQPMVKGPRDELPIRHNHSGEAEHQSVT